MMTALPTARPAYGLEGPSAGRAVDNATPQGSTYLCANSVQSNGTGSLRQAAPWITLHRRAPLISVQILSNQTGPALVPPARPGKSAPATRRRADFCHMLLSLARMYQNRYDTLQ